MSHSIGTDEHYITRDVESHRKKYAECYPHLRLSEPSPDALVKFSKQLEDEDQQIKSLQETVEKLEPLMKFMAGLKNQSDALNLYISAWANTKVVREIEKYGKSQSLEEELTDEEGVKAEEITEKINIELAETLRKALDLGLEQLTKKRERHTGQNKTC